MIFKTHKVFTEVFENKRVIIKTAVIFNLLVYDIGSQKSKKATTV
jgi:hypothetical protein